MTAFIALRFVLEIIGYATLPDDAKEAHGVLRVLADMVLALPWWAIWWPLFLSYIATCLIALDFSFDIFKREPKHLPQSDLDRLYILSNNFTREFSEIQSAYFKFYSSEHEISSISKVEIFRKRLSEFGIPELNKNSDLISDILQLKLIVSRYMPYLESGDYEKAIEVANASALRLN